MLVGDCGYLWVLVGDLLIEFDTDIRVGGMIRLDEHQPTDTERQADCQIDRRAYLLRYRWFDILADHQT